MDEDFANNNDHHRRTLDEDSEEPMDADHDNTKEHEGEKDSEDEKMVPSMTKMPFPASFLGLAGSPAGLTLPPPPPVGPPATSSILTPSGSPVSGLLSSPHPNANLVTDQLKNISMTISQLTSNLANTSSPKSVQELAVLQGTLFTLQQQQLLHMQILAQMQQQAKQDSNSTDSKQEGSVSGAGGNVQMPNSIAELAKKMEEQNSLEPPAQPIIPASLLKDHNSGSTGTYFSLISRG